MKTQRKQKIFENIYLGRMPKSFVHIHSKTLYHFL